MTESEVLRVLLRELRDAFRKRKLRDTVRDAQLAYLSAVMKLRDLKKQSKVTLVGSQEKED